MTRGNAGGSMSREMYPRPVREEIAERLAGPDQAEELFASRDPEPDPEKAPGPLANFAVHLSARMRALGWDQAALQEKAGIGAHTAAKAINGTACDLGLAGRIAGLVGGYLAAMIGPYMCSTCHGEPPAGFACLECGAEARQS